MVAPKPDHIVTVNTIADKMGSQAVAKNLALAVVAPNARALVQVEFFGSVLHYVVVTAADAKGEREANIVMY